MCFVAWHEGKIMYANTMSRNTMLAIVALMLVALVGGAGAFWAYKKYKQKQSQEYQMEGTIKISSETFDLDGFKKMILADEVLDGVVEKHQLISAWGVADESAAKAQLKKKFTASINEGDLKVRYQDKDKELAASILKTMLALYREKYSPVGQPEPSGTDQ